MPDFNLLPSEEKEKMKAEKTIFSLLNILNIIFLIIILLLFSFLSIYFYLNILVENQKELVKERSSSFFYKRVQEIDDEIATLNSEINKIYDLKKKFIYPSLILEEISNLIPDNDVYLKQLNITPKTEIITQEAETSDEKKSVSTDNEDSKDNQKSESKKKEVKRIEKDYLEINISGFARTRDKVLEVESLLRNSPMFSEIISPVENIIFPYDIDFVFTFKLKDSTSNKW